jgi:uncharacterized protein with GYD domain
MLPESFSPMPSYIAMLRWANEGAGDVKDKRSRLDAAKKISEHGVAMRSFYMTQGSTT